MRRHRGYAHAEEVRGETVKLVESMLVLAAAQEWWEGKRPVKYSLEEHLKCPTVNTTTEAEKVLAQRVADYLRK